MLYSPHIPSSPSALFKRLRTASASFSPFASIRRSGFFANAAVADQDNKSASVRLASSDSSSEDDDLSIASKRVWGVFGDSMSDGEDGEVGRLDLDLDTPSQDI